MQLCYFLMLLNHCEWSRLFCPATFCLAIVHSIFIKKMSRTCGQQCGGFGEKFGGTVSQSKQWGSKTSRPKSVGHSIVMHSVFPPSAHMQNEMHSSYHSAPTLYVFPLWLQEPLSAILSEMFVLITSAGRTTCRAAPVRVPSVTRT